MKIAYVSKTLHSGLPEKMAMAVNEYTEHEAVALVPGAWIDGKRRFHLLERTDYGVCWNINVPESLNFVLETCDVIHCMYNTSLDDLGRPDLAKKKTVVWHLATKWNRVFESLFPRGPGRTQFVLSAEGWCRYGLWDHVQWRQLPVVFLLDHPAYQPLPFSRRTRHASMSIRVKLDTTDDGRPIAAPRSSKKVAEALKGLKFRRIHGLDFQQCMRRKATAWIGIDDVVNPLVHQSGFEYLALGVPCVNLASNLLYPVISDAYGVGNRSDFFSMVKGFPFVELDDGYRWKNLRVLISNMLTADNERCQLWNSNARAWMVHYAHPRYTIRRYLEIYEKASVT